MSATEQASAAPVWSAPAGWYSGSRWRQRYWDGSRWTDRWRVYRNRAVTVGALMAAVGIVFFVVCWGVGLGLMALNTERFYDPNAELETALLLFGALFGVPVIVGGVVTTSVGFGIGARDRRRFNTPRKPPPSPPA